MSIKDFFQSEWAGVAEAWKRWGSAVRTQSAAATDWLVDRAGIHEGMSVLDLASGVGDPAVALARRVGPTGRVVASDLVPGTLEFVARSARTEGLGQLATQQADMEDLPFADRSFDAVTCRLGLMFCPRPELALAEARRVLRPGGKAVFIVWGAPSQPLFAATIGEIQRALAVGSQGRETREGDAPEGPGPFRFADQSRLLGALAATGFSPADVDELVVPWPFMGASAEMWRMFCELGGPTFQSTLGVLDEAVRRSLEDRIVAALERHRLGAIVDPTAHLVGACGVAP